MAPVSEMQRSPRAMNRMDPDAKVVHARLEEWARWAKDIGIAGYPRQSLTEKAATYGKLGIPQEPLHKPEPVMPDHVARVDAAVCRLGSAEQKALRLYYLQWDATENLARKCGMQWRQYLNVVRRARWLVFAYLDVVEENSLIANSKGGK